MQELAGRRASNQVGYRRSECGTKQPPLLLKSGNLICGIGQVTSIIRGVGILIKKIHTENIMHIKSISPRVIILILKIIQVYASTSDYSDDEIDTLHEDISKALQPFT